MGDSIRRRLGLGGPDHHHLRVHGRGRATPPRGPRSRGLTPDALSQPLAERAGVRLAVHVPAVHDNVHVPAPAPGPPSVRQRPGPRPEPHPDAGHPHLAGRAASPARAGRVLVPARVPGPAVRVPEGASPGQFVHQQPRRLPIVGSAGATLAQTARRRLRVCPARGQPDSALPQRPHPSRDHPTLVVGGVDALLRLTPGAVLPPEPGEAGHEPAVRDAPPIHLLLRPLPRARLAVGRYRPARPLVLGPPLDGPAGFGVSALRPSAAVPPARQGTQRAIDLPARLTSHITGHFYLTPC